jgi:hypothetical protein
MTVTLPTDQQTYEIRALNSLSNGRTRQDGSSDSGGKLHLVCVLNWTGESCNGIQQVGRRGQQGERCMRYIYIVANSGQTCSMGGPQSGIRGLSKVTAVLSRLCLIGSMIGVPTRPRVRAPNGCKACKVKT